MNEEKKLRLTVASSPHVASPIDTTNLMRDVLIALVPAMVMGVVFFGPRALVATIISVLACEFFEWGYRKLMHKSCAVKDLSAAVTGVLLGLTNYVTAPFIAANNEKTTQEAMAAVLPANSYDEVEYTGGDAMVQAVYKAGDAGYVVEVKPATSFSGNLTIMVGVDNTGACSGISITSTGETSGLGSNASKPDFQAQFVGKTGEVKVTKDGGDIDALTGATITSRGVCEAVTSAIAAAASMG